VIANRKEVKDNLCEALANVADMLYLFLTLEDDEHEAYLNRDRTPELEQRHADYMQEMMQLREKIDAMEQDYQEKMDQLSALPAELRETLEPILTVIGLPINTMKRELAEVTELVNQAEADLAELTAAKESIQF